MKLITVITEMGATFARIWVRESPGNEPLLKH